MRTQINGKLGEDTACKLLRKKHYKILARNYRKPYGEIDIVAQHKQRIAFVEVKTRTGTDFGLPCESVTVSKQQKIIKTAQMYVQEHNLDGEFAFDIVEVLLENDKVREVRHIEDAFST